MSLEDEILGPEELDRSDVEDRPVVKFVNKVVLAAIKEGAQQIHFDLKSAPEDDKGYFTVAMTVNGSRKQIAEVPAPLWAKVINRLKVMAQSVDYGPKRTEKPVIEFRISRNRWYRIALLSNPNPYTDSLLTLELNEHDPSPLS